LHEDTLLEPTLQVLDLELEEERLLFKVFSQQKEEQQLCLHLGRVCFGLLSCFSVCGGCRLRLD
jgi:hypothetical protein